jgi:hypothetical protein
MKEKLTWEDAHLFDYISAVEYLYVPDVDDYEYNINLVVSNSNAEIGEKVEAPVFGYSEISVIFKNRYNEGKLSKQHLYREYLDAVRHLLKELELDVDKFWCLFLFALDYCESLFYQGITMKATPLEQLQALANMIANADNETMLLKFKAGKQKTSVESPVALRFLADAIHNHLKNADYATTKSLYVREEEEEAVIPKDSPIITYFAKILLNFFDTQEQVRNKRKEGANHSLKEMELVSLLVYFSRLSDNKSWTDIVNETLKGFLRQYKDYKYPNNVSSIYPEFSVY